MANPNQYGSFIPTTNIWDVGQFMETDVKSREFKELLVRLYQNVNNIAIALNTKDTGIYDKSEFVNGQIYFPNPTTPVTANQSANFRQVYRQVYLFGALANNGTVQQTHGITVDQNTTFTRIYGVANDPTGFTYLPLPFADGPGNFDIRVVVDNTDIYITTFDDKTMYTINYVILEYLLY